ncbi:MAG: glucose-6-phosphate dehydrogenase assembly protein OpcA [Isosphaeraceae bacterium]|nr:glucose-6-phosphate dehydrogenase assembly protein OpcA [Isosphaeraceae bacterium]
MSHLRTDAFLSGLGVEVDPSAIESALVDLWGPAAQRVGGPEVENPPVTRVVLANLVVEADASRLPLIAKTLETIVGRFPCRAIVVVRTEEPGRAVRAEVAALCHLPAPGMPQVCSERIVLSAGPDALELVTGAVRPLLEPDMPVVLWWTDDPRRAPTLYRALAAEATRVLLDLEESASDALAHALRPELNPFIRDTAWFGLTPWRELIAQCFEGPGRLSLLERIRRVEVLALAPPGLDHPPRAAVWLGAWLAGQLGWTLESTARTSGPNGPRLDARFHSPSGAVDLLLASEIASGLVDPRVVEVRLTKTDEAGSTRIRFARDPRDSACVRVEIADDHAEEPTRLVDLPITTPARKISAGLESARHDLPFQHAAPIALALLASR